MSDAWIIPVLAAFLGGVCILLSISVVRFRQQLYDLRLAHKVLVAQNADMRQQLGAPVGSPERLRQLEGKTVRSTEHRIAKEGEHVFQLNFDDGLYLKFLDKTGEHLMVPYAWRLE